MAQTDLPPVPLKTAMTDEQGGLTQPWLKWFIAVMRRVGGNTAPTNNDLLLDPMSTLGDTIYGGVAGSATRLAGNTAASKKFLSQTGNGSASAAPAWSGVAASDVTGTVAIASGGTGQTTQQAAIDALAGTQSSGKYLRSDGTHTTLASIQVTDVPTLNQSTTGNATTATKPASGSAHGAVTLNSSGNFQSVAPGSSGNVLTSDGTDWVSQAAASGSAPTGSVMDFAGSSAPTGWQLCDGSAINRTTFAALFAVIGTTYGAGNGTTTFNVPDARGRVSVAAGTGSGLTARSLAAMGGEETHTLTVTEMPSHSHTANIDANAAGGDGRLNQLYNSVSGFVGTTSALNNNTGGDGAHNTMPPFLVLNRIIKT